MVESSLFPYYRYNIYFLFQHMNNDDLLRSYINEVFSKYDHEKKGVLNGDQITEFFNDLFRSLNMGQTVRLDELVASLNVVDLQINNNLTPDDVFKLFKALMDVNSEPPSQPLGQKNNLPGQFNPMMMNPYQQQAMFINPNNMAYFSPAQMTQLQQLQLQQQQFQMQMQQQQQYQKLQQQQIQQQQQKQQQQQLQNLQKQQQEQQQKQLQQLQLLQQQQLFQQMQQMQQNMKGGKK